ncbi:DUF4998 domain-containing protein [Flavivirga sp. 57AJ16]|uniref:DUF4998 domain-containing protein n=1 Tax=Flavivirga sp. 57AJ16 TaxID=3025307 RepID=UPI0023669E06|nr:DUF4998 domain-containing protein [Flavivirga sp. 57AJ16]MDD7887730.1 DUF4998 domain-containing protein [Flavivirga sp. 57AJ16]
MRKLINIKSTIPLLTLTIMMVFWLGSCDKMDDNYQQYIENGETLYTPKPIDLIGKTGNQRIQLEWDITSNANTDEWVVTYNDVELTFTNTNTTHKEYIVDNIEEGDYIFTIWGKSNSEGASLKETIIVPVFGETYRQSLNPREISSFYFDGTNAKIIFKNSLALAKSTEVKYFNTSGTEVTTVLEKDEFEIDLLDLDFDKEIQYRTFYLPTAPIEIIDEETSEIILVETSIDEFDSNWEIVPTSPFSAPNLDRSSWVAIEESSIAFDGWNIERMWDNDINSAWHTPWDGTNYPHHFVIDMGEEKILTGFEIARKWDWRVTTKTKFEVSTDNTNWTDLGEFINPNPDSDDPQVFDFTSNPNARYFRVTFLEGNGSEAIIREFYVKGI